MKVKFVPQNVEFDIAPGQSLMTFAQEKGIPIRSTCNGMPSCAECRVRVIEGESNVNPPSKKELNLIGTGYYIDQRRLSCQVQCFGDIVVDTTEQLEKVSEGPITKKYLSRVQKTSASDTHSLGGVLIEQDEALLKQIESTVAAPTAGGGGGNGPVHESQRPRNQQHQQRSEHRRDHRGGGHGGHGNPRAGGSGGQSTGQGGGHGGGQGGGDNRNNNRHRGRDRHRGNR